MNDLLNEPLDTGSFGPVPEALLGLFEKDPLSLSKQEIKSICSMLRAQRQEFLKEEFSAKNEGRKGNYKKATTIDISKIEF